MRLLRLIKLHAWIEFTDLHTGNSRSGASSWPFTEPSECFSFENAVPKRKTGAHSFLPLRRSGGWNMHGSECEELTNDTSPEEKSP